MTTKQQRRERYQIKKRRWKQRGSDREDKDKNKHSTPLTTVMFVPQTKDGVLLDKLQVEEDILQEKSAWGSKLVEKPGTLLLIKFIRKFPMQQGCSRGDLCILCGNRGKIA